MLALGGIGQGANAQDIWREAQTGKAVVDYPYRAEPDPGHPNRALRPITEDNFYRDEDGTWRNMRTGVAVRSYPYGAEVDPGDPDKAFSPGTGERFYREGAALAAATLPRPGFGVLFVNPKVSFGGFRSSGTATYASDGGQDPFATRFAITRPQFCGGASLGTGGDVAVMIDVSACTQMHRHTFFSIPRNADGLVALTASSPFVLDVLLKGQVALTRPTSADWMGPIFLSAGAGPTLRQSTLTLASDQTALGAEVFSISNSTWQAGLVASAGLSTFACLTCIAGGPLDVGIEGRARFFRSRSVSLLSPAFGFTETGSTGRTTDYSVLLTVGFPFAIK